MSLHRLFDRVRQKQIKRDLPILNFGDTVRVGVLVKEGAKKRVPVYQGTLIAQHRSGRDTTITVHRSFQKVSVERIFPIHSPLVLYVKIFRRAKVRRAKLYYLRSLEGKAARLRERFLKKKCLVFFLCFFIRRVLKYRKILQ